jgi:peptide/nickel transport system substrate-binding protein
MNRHSKLLGGVALCAAVALAATACSSSKSSGASGKASAPATTLPSGGTNAATGFNAAINGIVNPSDKEGGTLTAVTRTDWDSPDPGNTYAAFSWDFMPLYGRSMMTYEQKPGADGTKVVPDLAEGKGEVSNNGLTWTYKLKHGVKYQDGTEVKAADVKYAIERSNWGQDVLSNGPNYFKQVVADTTKYAGPYTDKNKADGVSGITTPDDYTIVFNLSSPFSDFDYLMALPSTVPVPQAKDTGLDYYKNIMATGQYKIDSYQKGVEMDLSPNTAFDPTTDPDKLHVLRASKIVVKLKIDKAAIDGKLFDGTGDVDLAGVGVQPETQQQILGDQTKKNDSDSAYANSEFYAAIDTQMKPFDNLDCRQAVEWVVNKKTQLQVAGGPVGGGDIATTVMPPTVPGYKQFDDYATPGNTGDATKAKASLAKCAAAEPDQFNADGTLKAGFNISIRDNSTKEEKAADALQNDLKSIGISMDIQKYDFGKYDSDFAGNTKYTNANKLAIQFYKWGWDFPTGFGYMAQIVGSTGIQAGGSGTTNHSYLSDPKVDALFKQALGETSQSAELADYAAIDKQVMDDAAIVPLIYNKNLVYRPEALTNVSFSQAFGMYNFASMGVK